MPNRIVKDSIHTSESVNAMTDFQFRLWISLITYVDDYGRGDARIPIIKGSCFPLRDRLTAKDIESGLRGLAGIGCVGLYEVDGKPYLYFPNWEQHQSIRNKKSKFPAPPINSGTIECNCNQLNANVPVIQSNPIQIESESESESNKGAGRAEKTPLEIAMDDFARMRKTIRKPMTDRARELILMDLEKLAPGDEEKKIAILNQSIKQGWQGVFALKDEDTHERGKNGRRGEHQRNSGEVSDWGLQADVE